MTEWLAQNWLSLLAAVFTGTVAVVAVSRYLAEKEDVNIRVDWDPHSNPYPPQFAQQGSTAQPVELKLMAMNLGGTNSKRGRVTVTAGPNFNTLDSRGWREDRPNAAMPPGSTAHFCKLAPLGRNEKVVLPPLRVVPKRSDLQGGTRTWPGRIRWEVWFGKKGGNSDDLKFQLKLSRP